MTDDDFLIDESPDDDAGGEEEDLLADVGGSGEDRLKSWEMDSQISGAPPAVGTPPPSPAPADARSASDELDDFLGGKAPPPEQDDLDMLLAAGGSTLEISALVVVPPDAGRGIPVMVVDPASAASEESPVGVALSRMGFKPTVYETAGSARDQLARGSSHEVVVLRIGADPGWAKMLMATSMQKWPQLRFIVVMPGGPQATTAAASIKTFGALQVVHEPLNDDVALLKAIQAVVPDQIPASAIPAPPPPRPPPALAQPVAARAAPPRPSVVNPGARPAAGVTPPPQKSPRDGELTAARNALTEAQNRITDLEIELAASRAQTEDARNRARDLDLKLSRPPAPDARLGEIKKILATHPYGVAMDHALTFLAELADKNAGNQNLARHVKNMKAVRAALKKVEEKLG